MAYKFTKKEINSYLDNMVNRVFALLGIYEDSQYSNDFNGYKIYLDRLITEINGLHSILKIESFMSILGILQGMSEIDNIDHKKVKSLTFYCISVIKKAKVV